MDRPILALADIYRDIQKKLLLLFIHCYQLSIEFVMGVFACLEAYSSSKPRYAMIKD